MLVGQAFAQTQPRIGFIDLNKVFDNYWKTKQARAILKDRVEGVVKDKNEMEADLTKLNGEYEKATKDAADPNISAEEREKRKNAATALLVKWRENKTELDTYLKRADENLASQRKRLGDRVLDEIKDAVAAKARTAGFTCVINSGAEGISGPAILFTNGENDITDSVLAGLNAGAPADPTADVKKTDEAKKPEDKKADLLRAEDVKKADDKK